MTIAGVGKGLGLKQSFFASTCSVYGANDEVFDERSAHCPISLCARTKMESERELMARLRLGLVQASLGDVDGFRNILVNMEVALSVQSEADSVLDRQSVLVEP